jgi:hypothetical protein
MEKYPVMQEALMRPDKDSYEYMLIAMPDSDVCNKVMEEKREFEKNYQQAALKSKPYITVSNFFARDEMEDTLIRWLQRIIGEQRSFVVTLNNYSGFPPHTVFLRVQDPSPFQELAKHLTPIDFYIKSNACPPLHFAHPHLSVARKLPSLVYEKAIMEYAGRLFHESFTVKELLLLRREYAHEACKQVAVLRLHPGNNYLNN